MRKQLEKRLLEKGYRAVSVNRPGFTLFYHITPMGCFVLLLGYEPDGRLPLPEEYLRMKQNVLEMFRTQGISRVEFLALLCVRDLERAKLLSEMDPDCWLLDLCARELILYENQRGDMDGIRNLVEELLQQPEPGFLKKIYADNLVPWVSLSLVFVNSLLFFICIFTGDLLYRAGAFGIEHILRDGQWYRIVTAIFLHADVNHLVSNMLLLYFAGKIVEGYLDHARYAILYLLSGIIGNLFSACYELWNGFYDSIGASGAVFGILGMLLALVLFHHGRLQKITLSRMLLMLVLSVYNGATVENINNVAHIGGLFAGFFLTSLYLLIRLMSDRIRTKKRGERKRRTYEN